MPLEIRELHIKVTVNQPGQDQSPAPANEKKTDDEKDAMIAQCVEQVLDIVNSKKER